MPEYVHACVKGKHVEEFVNGYFVLKSNDVFVGGNSLLLMFADVARRNGKTEIPV